MPEGPSIVIAAEAASMFEGREVVAVAGNTKADISRLKGQTVTAIKSWGKHLLVCFGDFTVRIHFLMFGSYRINERKPTPVRLGLEFPNGELNFYTCSVKILEGTADANYDWSGDVMNDAWNPKKARAKLKAVPDLEACDALLEQDIFAGVGNIIKNEVLYRIKVHPESLVGKMPAMRLNDMIREARRYSFQFLEWKKAFVLKKHWLAHTKKTCQRCDLPLVKKHTGKKGRRSFFCPNCQKRYS
jgi:endonuclease-8